jgi:hypothetical protein
LGSFRNFHLTADYADIADAGALSLEPGALIRRAERCSPHVTDLTSHSFNLLGKWLRLVIFLFEPRMHTKKHGSEMGSFRKNCLLHPAAMPFSFSPPHPFPLSFLRAERMASFRKKQHVRLPV